MTREQHKLRILFLEDIPSDAEIAVRELRKSGLEFYYELAEDKIRFQNALVEFKPELVISDFILPTIDGLEAIRMSLQHDPEVPVIVLTGSMDEQTAVACMKAGATDYVVKDFMAKLPFAVREAMDKKMAKKELEKKTEELSTYFETALDLFCLADLDGYFLRLNPSWETTLGYKPENMEGKKFLDFVHPDDIDPTIKTLEYLANENQINSFVNRYRHINGTYKYIEWRSRPRGNMIFSAARDITDRILNEQKLKEDEEKYRILFENNPLPMWVYDPETLRFVTVNAVAVIKYGYTRDEFLQMSLKDIRPEEDIPLLVSNICKTDSDYDKSGPWRHRLKSGEIILVEISSHGLEFEGRPCRMVMANDVTQRVRDEDEIKKLNRVYSVLSNINKSIVRINESDQLLDEICRVVINFGEFLFVWIGKLDNESNEIRVLAAEGEYAGRMQREGNPLKGTLLSKAPCMQAIWESRKMILNSIENIEKHCFITEDNLNGRVKSVACFPFGMPENEKALICFYSSDEDFFDEKETNLIEELTVDISFALSTIENEKKRKEAIENLRKSESRYRKFFEEDLTADYISTIAGEVVDCNNAYVRMFGFSDRDHAMAIKTTDLYFDPSDRTNFLNLIKKKGSIENHEIIYKTIDGRKIHAILNAFGHFDSEDNLLRIQGYIFDITDIKRAQLEMKEARELAERSNKLKDAFIANISHEIRTPMNAIIGFSGIIREALADKIDAETSGYFSIIDEAGARLMRTVDMILNLSKIQSGIMESKTEQISIDSSITASINQHQPAALKKGIPVTYLNKTGISTIESDEYCFTEIISNLIDNAVTYTHKGKIEIIVNRNRKGDLVIDVKDTGIGIGSEFRENIFQPFIQEEIGYSRPYEGVGLGLSLVRKFSEIAGFDIHLESEKGEGSTFSLIIPATFIRSSIEMRSDSKETKHNLYPSRQKEQEDRPVILSVEDDEDSKFYMETVLSKRFEVISVASAEEVMPAVKRFSPVLILMDISLKGSRNGLEITRDIKRIPEYTDLPVIAVTAHAFPSDRINALEAGCDDYITKPFSSKTLNKTIDKALGRTI